MKTKLLLALSGIITLLLGLLGCSDEDQGAAEYGTPHARFYMRGKVVDSGTRRPIPNVRTVMYYSKDGETDYTSGQADQNGNFYLDCTVWPWSDEYVFYLELYDHDGEENGLYESVKMRYEYESLDFIDPLGGWYAGYVEKDVGEVPMKPVEHERK